LTALGSIHDVTWNAVMGVFSPNYRYAYAMPLRDMSEYDSDYDSTTKSVSPNQNYTIGYCHSSCSAGEPFPGQIAMVMHVERDVSADEFKMIGMGADPRDLFMDDPTEIVGCWPLSERYTTTSTPDSSRNRVGLTFPDGGGGAADPVAGVSNPAIWSNVGYPEMI
jgi:hypothetical protein